VFSRFDDVIHVGQKYTFSSPSDRGMSVDYKSVFGRPYYRSSHWYSVSSVCRLSVTFCIVAKRCSVLAKKCLKE